MNDEKCKALKVLGFNYLTRDIDGTLTAWNTEPNRQVTCLQEKESEIREKYPDAIINIDKESEWDEEDYWQNGIFIPSSRFYSSEKDLEDGRTRNANFALYEENDEFKEVTWTNSPYVIETKN